MDHLRHENHVIHGGGGGGGSCNQSEDEMDLRRGPWTVEEDFTLINYIAHHGEGRWNSLARSAGLKRTGKSCRLRWLNYLRPDVRRGNITLEEQLLILELHSRWGNRWSKIAQQLPGRTDNEIKNYWRTRVQKHAKQLKCDVNSKQFKDTMRYLWMPRLVERIHAAAAASASGTTTTTTAAAADHLNSIVPSSSGQELMVAQQQQQQQHSSNMNSSNHHHHHLMSSSSYTPENSSTAASSDSFGAQVSPVSDLTDCYNYPVTNNLVPTPSSSGYFMSQQGLAEFEEVAGSMEEEGADVITTDSLWGDDVVWFLHPQFNNTTTFEDYY